MIALTCFSQQLELVSTAGSAGAPPANGSSSSPVIAADSRHVAFHSTSSDLVARDTNRRSDVFVRDRHAGTTARVSLKDIGLDQTCLNPRPPVVGPYYCYQHPMPADCCRTEVLDTLQSDGDSYDPAISADGQVVAFVSTARNLVLDPPPGASHVYLHSTATRTTRCVSTGLGNPSCLFEVATPAISGDGRWVAFVARAIGTVEGASESCQEGWAWHAFAYDDLNGTVRRISVTPDGRPANASTLYPSLSSSGSHLAFASFASDLVDGDTNGYADIFVAHLGSGHIQLVSVGPGGTPLNNHSVKPSLSADASYVAFSSFATNLGSSPAAGHSNIWVVTRATGGTSLVSAGSVMSSCAEAEGSFEPTVSADGRWVAFSTTTCNLDPPDTNGKSDVLLWDRLDGTIKSMCVGWDGGQANGASFDPSIAIDASNVTVVWESAASNLVQFDGNGSLDVFAGTIGLAPE
jgi:Tol biopolymer transport system component